jgi:DNA excision repair protein ERCC-2
METGSLIPPGIWTLADVLQYGRDNGVCPYFTVRRMVKTFDAFDAVYSSRS